MHHHLGSRSLHYGLKRGAVINVGLNETTPGRETKQIVKVRLGDWCEGEAKDLSPHLSQPESQPCALEAGMAGDQHTPPGPKAHHQHFQGALPEAQSSSKQVRSRRVSIGWK